MPVLIIKTPILSIDCHCLHVFIPDPPILPPGHILPLLFKAIKLAPCQNQIFFYFVTFQAISKFMFTCKCIKNSLVEEKLLASLYYCQSNCHYRLLLTLLLSQIGQQDSYHPLDGIANPKHKLLQSLTTNNFLQREEGTSF